MTEGLRQDKGTLILAENAVKDAAIESTRRCSHLRFLWKPSYGRIIDLEFNELMYDTFLLD